MPTDRTSPATFRRALDQRLTAAFTAELSPRALDALNSRFRAAYDAKRANERRRHGLRRRLRRPTIVLVAAALVVGLAATPGVRHLFDGWGGGTFSDIWRLATPIDLSAIDDGYRITIARAYADPNGLWIGMAVEDTRDRGWDEIVLAGTQVTDEAGRDYPGVLAETGAHTATSSESWTMFDVPLDLAGGVTHHLSIVVSGIRVRDGAVPAQTVPGSPTLAAEAGAAARWHTIGGTWAFDFDLPVHRAVAVEPGVRTNADGITASVERLVISPTSVVGTIALEGLPDDVDEWAPGLIAVEHDGERLTLWWTQGTTATARSLGFETEEGFVDPAGRWSVTITDLVGLATDRATGLGVDTDPIPGPWVLSFDYP